MKNMKVKLTAAILLSTSFVFANTAVQAAKDAQAEPSTQKVDKAEEKGSDKTQAGKSTSGNSKPSASEDLQSNDEPSSHPSNMDINGKTHAELNNLAGRPHTPSSDEARVADEN